MLKIKSILVSLLVVAALASCSNENLEENPEVEGGAGYPKDYFNPYESTTGSLCITNNTVSIHWYMGSCLSKYQKIRSIISKPLHRIFGVDIMRKLRK